MRHTDGIVLLFSTLAVAACTATPERDHDGDQRRGAPARAESPRPVEPTVRSQTQTFYRVTRPDFRKCVYPLCGGVFIAEVNHSQSTCADNQTAADCYVSDIDLAALGLDPQLESEIANLADGGNVLLRGELQAESTAYGPIGKLIVDAAWRGATLNPPTDPTYLVMDSNIVCITFPCFSLTELTVNSSVTTALAGVDLTASGAGQDDLATAQSLLATPGLFVAGTHITVNGPAGQGQQLVASEIYLPVEPSGSETCGSSVCGSGEFCCNPSCGICAPLGGVCTEQACHPCGHDECDSGDALEASCSSCATKVCNADPYCCDNAWDSLCVKEAAQLCNACEQTPQPACVHSECAEGAKLDLACSSCATDVCNQDAFCCNNSWDALCVQQAGQLCGNTCTPLPSCAHSECSEGGTLEASCSSCAAIVCGSDAYCCGTAWDGLCVDEASSWCGNTCPG